MALGKEAEHTPQPRASFALLGVSGTMGVPPQASLVYLTNIKVTGKNLSKMVFIRQD